MSKKKKSTNNTEQLSLLFNTPEELTQEQKDIIALINRHRRQVLVHSCLYYRLDTNLIEDYQYDKIGRELVRLQKQYPELLKYCIYNKEYEDYGKEDCYSGFNLPYSMPEIVHKAEQLLWYSEHRK